MQLNKIQGILLAYPTDISPFKYNNNVEPIALLALQKVL